MDSFNDPEIEHIIFCKATQIGGTESIFNMLGYVIDQDPGPTLIVYPIDSLAKFVSENRIEPFVRHCPTLSDKYHKKESEKLELQFDNMYVALGGANSPAQLASRPIRYVFRDEVDKFPKWSGDEANPIKLTDERTKNFYNRKKVDTSTPTLETGNIWQMLISADIVYKYKVPCPHCGHYQIFQFKQLKWPDEFDHDPKLAASNAYYECEHCRQHIYDHHKMAMLRAGKWVGGIFIKENENEKEKWVEGKRKSGRAKSVGFHLSSFYSPWVTFGQIVKEFLDSKDIPEKLMNFINSWLAEPWVDKANRMRSDIIMEQQADHDRGIVPADALLITAGVDVQKDHFWWSIRAWGELITSWLVDYGRAETWTEIEEILDRAYPNVYGEALYINLMGLDSGFNTDEVYEFCITHQGLCIPTKGSSKRMTSRYLITNIDKKDKYFGLKLYVLDTSQYKDSIVSRLNRKPGTPGAWMVCKGVERYYADQVCAEQKVLIKDKKGRTHEEWQPISSHAQNHFLDTEVINMAVAEIAGVRYLKKQSKTENDNPIDENKPKNDWVPDRKWF